MGATTSVRVLIRWGCHVGRNQPLRNGGTDRNWHAGPQRYPNNLEGTLIFVDPSFARTPGIGLPQCDDLRAVRGRPLSQLTFPSENYHRAGHPGRFQAATLADMTRSPHGVPPAGHLRRPTRTHPIVPFWTGEVHLAASLLAIVTAPGSHFDGTSVICSECVAAAQIICT